MSNLDIGFAEECDSWLLESNQFPSKIGGKPAWLDLNCLPTSTDLKCLTCEKQMIFLCQIYAPYEECLNNFHRTIYVFICRNSQCSKRNDSQNMKVFRSHLPKQNKYYSDTPPLDMPDPTFDLKKWNKLCKLCGCLAAKHCSKCQEPYCCREHQIVDWTEHHKHECGNETKSEPIVSKLLFPQFQLAIESEESNKQEVNPDIALQEYKKLEMDGKLGTLSDVPENVLESHASVNEDITFSRFSKRINLDPDQVLRYERGGIPLWISKEALPMDIPNCENCNQPRQFEFQIMPQMLTIIKENDLDWGILIIYTCKQSCTDGKSYKCEFIIKQDV